MKRFISVLFLIFLSSMLTSCSMVSDTSITEENLASKQSNKNIIGNWEDSNLAVYASSSRNIVRINSSLIDDFSMLRVNSESEDAIIFNNYLESEGFGDYDLILLQPQVISNNSKAIDDLSLDLLLKTDYVSELMGDVSDDTELRALALERNANEVLSVDEIKLSSDENNVLNYSLNFHDLSYPIALAVTTVSSEADPNFTLQTYLNFKSVVQNEIEPNAVMDGPLLMIDTSDDNFSSYKESQSLDSYGQFSNEFNNLPENGQTGPEYTKYDTNDSESYVVNNDNWTADVFSVDFENGWTVPISQEDTLNTSPNVGVMETETQLVPLFMDEQTNYRSNPQIEYMDRLYNSEEDYNSDYTLSQIWVYQPENNTGNTYTDTSKLTASDFIAYNVPTNPIDPEYHLPQQIRFTNNPTNSHITANLPGFTVSNTEVPDGFNPEDYSGLKVVTSPAPYENTNETYPYCYTILIQPGTVIRFVYNTTEDELTETSANFFDYDISDGYLYKSQEIVNDLYDRNSGVTPENDGMSVSSQEPAVILSEVPNLQTTIYTGDTNLATVSDNIVKSGDTPGAGIIHSSYTDTEGKLHEGFAPLLILDTGQTNIYLNYNKPITMDNSGENLFLAFWGISGTYPGTNWKGSQLTNRKYNILEYPQYCNEDFKVEFNPQTGLINLEGKGIAVLYFTLNFNNTASDGTVTVENYATVGLINTTGIEDSLQITPNPFILGINTTTSINIATDIEDPEDYYTNTYKQGINNDSNYSGSGNANGTAGGAKIGFGGDRGTGLDMELWENGSYTDDGQRIDMKNAINMGNTVGFNGNNISNLGWCTFNLVDSISYSPLASSEDNIFAYPLWSDGINAPNLFGTTEQVGKTIYSEDQTVSTYKNEYYKLNWFRRGGTYIMDRVVHYSNGEMNYASEGLMNFKLNYANEYSNQFWPMDDSLTWGTDGHDLKYGGYENYALSGSDEPEIVNWTGNTYFPAVGHDRNNLYGPPNSETESIAYIYNHPYFQLSEEGAEQEIWTHGVAHNGSFGMSYTIEFTLEPGYIAPLEYWFYGDDDMWVFLDAYSQNGEILDDEPMLIADIGGVHPSIGTFVNLWNWITPIPYEDEDGNLNTAEESITYRMTVFFTERGGGGESSCYTRFTLPLNANTIDNNNYTQELKYEKAAYDNEGNELAYNPSWQYEGDTWNAASEEAAENLYDYTLYLTNSDGIQYEDIYSYGVYSVADPLTHSDSYLLKTGVIGTASTISGEYHFSLFPGTYIIIYELPDSATYTVIESDMESSNTTNLVGSNSRADNDNSTTNTFSDMAVKLTQSLTDGDYSPDTLTIGVNNNVYFNIEVINISDRLLTDVQIVDAVPVNLSINENSITNDGTLNGQIITWNIGNIPVGETVNVSFNTTVINVNSATHLYNTANVYYNDLSYVTSYQQGNHEDLSNGQSEDILEAIHTYNNTATGQITDINAEIGVYNYVKFYNTSALKAEITPGAQENVDVGDVITYEIVWPNDPTGSVTTIVTDQLDPGVDFVAAKFGSSYVADGTSIPTTQYNLIAPNASYQSTDLGTITYDNTTHTVTWTVNQITNMSIGVVALQVKVNEKALIYDSNQDPYPDDTNASVQNRASLTIGDNTYTTEIITNPVGEATGSITITKTLTGLTTDTYYPITVNFGYESPDAPYSGSAKVTYTGQVNGISSNEIEIVDGQLNFSLQAGSSITIYNLPLPMYFNVFETVPDGYEVTYSNSSGMLSETNLSATTNVINEYIEVNNPTLTIIKNAPQAAKDEVFNFIVSFMDSNNSPVSGTISYSYSNSDTIHEDNLENGKIQIQLSAGESITFYDLDYGVKYFVSEVDVKNYTPTYQGNNGEISETNDEAIIIVTNHYVGSTTGTIMGTPTSGSSSPKTGIEYPFVNFFIILIASTIIIVSAKNFKKYLNKQR